MDLNQPLFWLALLGGLVMAVRGARSFRAGERVSLFIGLVVMAVAGIGHLVSPDEAGYFAFGAWALTVLLPNLVARRLQAAVDRHDHVSAVRLARILAVLHPSTSARLAAIDRQANALAQRGDTAAADALLARTAERGGLVGTWATMERLRLAGSWAEIARYFDTRVTDAEITALPSFIGVYLRALGETGQRAAMFRSFARFERRLDGDALTRHRSVVWLIVLAFAGGRADVDRLLAGHLTSFSADLKRFWQATADLAAGYGDEAIRAFEELSRSADMQLSRAAKRRLAERDLFVAEPLTEPQREDVGRILQALDQETRFGLSVRGRPRPYAVIALIGLNVAMFVVEETVGDSTSDATLMSLGALFSPAVVDGHEWWRLGACLFLHWGAAHLVINMLGLWVLGPFVEYALGRLRWVVTYLGSGLVGSLVLTVLPRFHLAKPELCVGASGCIMGLVGATMAITLRGVMRERSAVAKRRLLTLGIIVVLQSIFDLEAPEVSFTAHASGLVAGFLIASALAHRTARPLARS